MTVVKHWIVIHHIPADDLSQAGMGERDSILHASLQAATTRAKELASANPGNYYVVYPAEWYAFTDITPVSLERVSTGAL